MGKKPNKKRAQRLRNERRLSKRLAEVQAGTHLAAHPNVVALRTEVQQFFGSQFEETIEATSGKSRFEIKLSASNDAVEHARIWVAGRSDRAVEAHAHELLHLRLAVRGMPGVVAVRTSDAQDCALKKLRELYPARADSVTRKFVNAIHEVVNLFEHSLFVGEFTNELGLDIEHFLYRSSPGDLEELDRILPRDEELRPLTISHWIIEWFRHFITATQGYAPVEERRYAAEAAKYAELNVPGFLEIQRRIQVVIHESCDLTPSTYMDAVSELCELTGTPRPSHVYALRRESNSVVVELSERE